MKVTEHLKRANGKTLFSVEILPPLKGKSIQSIYDILDPMMEFKPAFIDVTYHREEYVYKKRENGLLEKFSMRKRPGTVGICAAIINHYKVDTVPHIICGGFAKEETENALIDLNFLGIDNVLLIRGDAIKSEAVFVPHPKGHNFAIDLVKQVVNMNQGMYLDEELNDVVPSKFCIGVAGYPEKHFEAPNMRSDMKHLKAKIDAGADYVVTQMFFDNKKYFDFVEKCREAGINVPIIPGLKPLTSIKQCTVLPKIFHVDIPEDLDDAIAQCKSDKDARKIGIDWCIQQSKELMKAGVPCLHYYTMGNADNTVSIAKELF
ncbi:MAG: methylenetetrahydrofolate reductase [NAD(P)H] [Bacteroidetes bacterium]|nr:MAG: methylenetetrahydrofolate reductase [NAD(P)H] [Bacteroidota bacterium]REK03415.1 MAG: methylenetetrahydrofolate reductase [NAD(P)H] [Bacteroidota bacterium]REK34473.1 MAG: methylenetetrahydrofolate reductase [NAD(P)H] [Bacteroidota bacterium]REK50409.1 MAG: methylenetetrahydrofolate reductase [NAD(P)H] [Bacteroidota bacterium]